MGAEEGGSDSSSNVISEVSARGSVKISKSLKVSSLLMNSMGERCSSWKVLLDISVLD